MAKKPARTMHDLRVAAMEGSHSAQRALLRHHGHGQLAGEIKKGFASPRAQRMLDAICAGTNTEWEPDIFFDDEPPRHASRVKNENLK